MSNLYIILQAFRDVHRILEEQELKIKKGQSFISCEEATQHELFKIGAAQYLQESNLTFTPEGNINTKLEALSKSQVPLPLQLIFVNLFTFKDLQRIEKSC